ncbi:hypothetical protein F5Y14DRAFT_424498 [Nemania sp. NC0429]|nr:hypothetical protein F5Y14DRAFT_424498 [Nemania sp. NC0429]
MWPCRTVHWTLFLPNICGTSHYPRTRVLIDEATSTGVLYGLPCKHPGCSLSPSQWAALKKRSITCSSTFNHTQVLKC